MSLKLNRTLLALSLSAILTACGGSSGGGGGNDDVLDEIVVTQNPTPVANPLVPTPQPDPTPQPEPMPQPEPAPEPEPTPQPEPEPIPQPDPEPIPQPEPPPEPEPTPQPEPEPQTIVPDGFITDVSSGDTQARFLAGPPPQPTGNLAALPFNSDVLTIISGGSSTLDLTWDNPYFRVYISSDDQGFFFLDLPQATNESPLLLSFSTIQLDGDTEEISLQIEQTDGAISEPTIIPVTTLAVGTGEVQVSVSWDQPVDLDLALVEPDGELIFWNNTNSNNGGMLDLDSNPACTIDGVNNENISYEGSTPPSGNYTVIVDLFAACGVVDPINYTVTVRANGNVQTFTGTYTVDGPSDEREITVFSVP